MASFKVRLLTLLTILILTLAMGLFTGLKNTSDYHISEYSFEGLDAEIKVYRDEWGVPTILAQTEGDLFFAQGYEYARDRLFQGEFFRSVASGELSRLFGASDSLLTADKYLRTLSMRVAAQNTYEKIGQSYLDKIQSYVDGYNTYIKNHIHNLPLEFVLLGVQPKEYTVLDVLSIQGVLSRTLSIDGLNQELFRMDLLRAFGAEEALQLYPLDYYTAEDYYRSYNGSLLSPSTLNALNLPGFLLSNNMGIEQASNNWVVGPQKSATGKPILANDPHLDLQTPGIWWQVHLNAPTYHVEGYALPGVPGIIIGHNDDVAWGVTNTGTDAVDLFYFETRNDDTEYLINGTWKEFVLDTQTIEIPGGDDVTFTIKRTDYGPVLDPDLFGVPEDGTYVMRWTLLENHPDDLIVKAVQDLNRAENVQDIHNALRYFNVPGQNFVYATVDGDYGYQYTGLAPIRTTPGSGVLPQNGSDPNFGWSGFVDYEDYLWERNPSKGFWATANQEIDYREETNKSDSFYIASLYAPPYRGERINALLDADNSVTVDDMKDIQGDTLDLYAKLMMEAVGSEIGSLELGNSLSDRFIGEADDARDQLMKWDYHMDRGSIGALVFAGFRIFFEEATFKDEFDQKSEFNDEDNIFYSRYADAAELGMAAIIDNPNSPWFDDVSTPDKVETRSDIVAQAFSETVEYLDSKISGRVASWKYGKLHHVVFEHPMGEALGILNIGGDGSDGSEHTVKAAGGTPSWTEDGPNFTQTHGPSMRFVAEVEPTWSEVYGIVAPGESSNFLSGHRNDGLDDWINNNSHKWNYTTERGGKPDFTYKVE